MQQTIFERITNQICEAIADGADDFTMPWHRSGCDLAAPFNVSSGRSYRGLNILTLWMSAQASGYASGQWATYRQWAAMDAQVRKGEKGTPIFFWERRQPAAADDGGADTDNRPAFVAKSFTVFNAAQVTGFRAEAPNPLLESERLERAEAFVAATGARIAEGGDCACYVPLRDTIEMPNFSQFRSSESYYAVLAHELTHWTGAKHRLDRQLSTRFGSEAYAMEELIAELGAAFTCVRLGIATEARRDHAPYVASWLKALRRDHRAIFTAASKAQEASDYLARITGGDRTQDQETVVANDAKAPV